MRPSRRDELVQQALEIFYRNGFSATGMDRLVNETGISKTSMYKYFGSKDELILAVLKLRDEQFRDWFFGRISDLGETPLEQVLVVFDVLEEWFEMEGFQGCMFIKAAAEFQNCEDPIYQQSTEHKVLIAEELCKRLKLCGLLKADELMRQLMLLMEGAIVMAQMGVFDKSAINAKQAARVLLDQAFLNQ